MKDLAHRTKRTKRFAGARRSLFVPMLQLVTTCSVGSSMPDSEAMRYEFRPKDASYSVGFLSNAPMNDLDSSVRHSIVVIHGNMRDAEGCFRSMIKAAAIAHDEHALIVVPRFPVERDLSREGGNLFFWSNDGWKQGDESVSSSTNLRTSRISSFAVIDEFINEMVGSGMFPALSHITLVGHSAGGQFVNRYAAGTQIPELIGKKHGIQFRFFVANPSSFLYLDTLRPVIGKSGNFVTPNASHCRRYNRYKYGLEELNPYMNAAGPEAIRANISQRAMMFLMGEADTSRSRADFDRSCAAMLQGTNRLQRGKYYYDYLQTFFTQGEPVLHRFVIVPGVGHSYSRMFCSPEMISHLFDLG